MSEAGVRFPSGLDNNLIGTDGVTNRGVVNKAPACGEIGCT